MLSSQGILIKYQLIQKRILELHEGIYVVNAEKTRESRITFISYTLIENHHFNLNVKMLEKIIKFSIFVLTHLIIVAAKSSLTNLMISFSLEICVYKCYLGYDCQGSTFPGARGHMPLDFAVRPYIFQSRGPK